MKRIGTTVLLAAIFFAMATPVRSDKSESECIVNTSRMEPRYVPYKETYKDRKWGPFYKLSIRYNYRIEWIAVQVTEKRCCDGYEDVDGDCRPVCSNTCVNGTCTSPNMCVCHPGYNYAHGSDHICEPICADGCEHGTCVSPGKCSCNDGYELFEGICRPLCYEDCGEINAECTAPNVCTCKSGFENIEDAIACTPVCKIPCVNGVCTAPDVCSCHDGFRMNLYNEFLCEPKCDQGCLFGYCTAPNTCTCDTGYKPKTENVCEPICSETCEMGVCIAPETCSCNNGYGLLADSRYKCRPICEKGCINGTCTAPGVCFCNDGWVLQSFEEEDFCAPFCKVPCEPFGICMEPNRCSCFDGFRMIDMDFTENEVPSNLPVELTTACEPVCDPRCINGKCIAPNHCECHPGYQSSNDSNVCEPFCATPCGTNSVCTEPDTCSCRAGYRLVDSDVSKGCEPVCKVDCKNGTCSAPDVCTCDEGFANDAEGGCAPVCGSCVNSTCVAPNTCGCLDGFVTLNDSVCVPFCGNKCENGDCVEPNECRCHSGYVTDQNGTCVAACARNCNGHGVCADDEKSCECSFGWTGWDCEQPTVCIFLMNFDDEIVNRVTVHNETNSTFSDARDNAPCCYQCNESLSNESFCFAIRWDDASPAIGCFIDADSPCYMSSQQANTAAVSTIAGTLAVVTILIMAGVTTAAYFLNRRHQRKKMRSVAAQGAMFQGSIANEALLSEEDGSHH